MNSTDLMQFLGGSADIKSKYGCKVVYYSGKNITLVFGVGFGYGYTKIPPMLICITPHENIAEFEIKQNTLLGKSIRTNHQWLTYDQLDEKIKEFACVDLTSAIDLLDVSDNEIESGEIEVDKDQPILRVTRNPDDIANFANSLKRKLKKLK
jgi:hypothetical protein